MAELTWYKDMHSIAAVKALQVTKENVAEIKDLVKSEEEPYVGDEGAVVEINGGYCYVEYGSYLVKENKISFAFYNKVSFQNKYKAVGKPSDQKDKWKGWNPITNSSEIPATTGSASPSTGSSGSSSAPGGSSGGGSGSGSPLP